MPDEALEAFALLGYNKAVGYEAIRQGTFPVPVLQLGRRIKIPTAPLLELLGLMPSRSPPPSAAA